MQNLPSVGSKYTLTMRKPLMRCFVWFYVDVLVILGNKQWPTNGWYGKCWHGVVPATISTDVINIRSSSAGSIKCYMGWQRYQRDSFKCNFPALNSLTMELNGFLKWIVLNWPVAFTILFTSCQHVVMLLHLLVCCLEPRHGIVSILYFLV